jgi:hypothetical protein
MDSIYVSCSEFENKRFNLRLISIEDCDDLLKVYSDKKAIPLFNSDNCGLLRLDLRSDYETKANIIDILKTIIDKAYQLFECNMIATKALPIASERVNALKELGFALTC